MSSRSNHHQRPACTLLRIRFSSGLLGPLCYHWIWPARNSGYEDREWATVNLGCVFPVPSMRGHLGTTIFLTKDISDEASGWHDSRSMPFSKGPALHSSVSFQYFTNSPAPSLVPLLPEFCQLLCFWIPFSHISGVIPSHSSSTRTLTERSFKGHSSLLGILLSPNFLFSDFLWIYSSSAVRTDLSGYNLPIQSISNFHRFFCTASPHPWWFSECQWSISSFELSTFKCSLDSQLFDKQFFFD